MRLPRGIVWRVVVATVLCGLLGFVSAPLVLRAASRDRVGRFNTPLIDYVYRTHERARCEADPASWSMQLGPDARAYAYDATTLTSHNVAAPALDRTAWARLARDPSLRATVDGRAILPRAASILVYRGSDRGPCAIIQTTVSPNPVASDLPLMLLLGGVFAAVAAAGVGLFLLVRPLERVETRRAELQRHLADVSHDLKTPIASLHLALEQSLAANHDPDVKPLLSSAMNDAVYLAALTANLRLASEMREGWDPARSTTGVDLTDVVERVATRARLLARQLDVTVEVAVPDDATRVACDPVAAEQAISNIVENAVTHGQAGGYVAVVLETDASTFTLGVTDDGPGIASTELPRLGQRTFRTDEARQRDPRGSGLGLAITNEICKSCGWTLAFEPQTPRGLRVTIEGERG